MRAAGALGVRSSLSTPVPLQQQAPAALDLYSTRPGVFGAESRATAASFAAYVGVALANTTLYGSTRLLAQELQAAMDSRAVIEQAEGVLMGQRHLSADEAFELLVGLSQSSQRKLRDVARAVVDTTVTGAPPPGAD